MTRFTPETARTEELALAFRLLLRHLPPADRDVRLANFLHLLSTGEIDPQGVFVLRGPGGLTATQVVVPMPGAGALLWPPVSVVDAWEQQREDALMRHACTWLRQRRVKVAQALLGPDERQLARPLVRNGLPLLTTLWYLRHDLRWPRYWSAPSPDVHFQAYDPDRPEAFQRTLERTYEQTLDCPEMSGVRTIEEVIEGHQAQGSFDPEHWWLVRTAGHPVGVVINVTVPETQEWEVAYMGLVPEARGHGLGTMLLHSVLRAAYQARAPRVLLSVDGRNTPARGLYRKVGFQASEGRDVYLAVWP